ncbi:hypothetical protein OG985_49200 (plasmid) [Streptomyces sp. NBC_00289]
MIVEMEQVGEAPQCGGESRFCRGPAGLLGVEKDATDTGETADGVVGFPEGSTMACGSAGVLLVSEALGVGGKPSHTWCQETEQPWVGIHGMSDECRGDDSARSGGDAGTRCGQGCFRGLQVSDGGVSKCRALIGEACEEDRGTGQSLEQ